MHPEAFSDDPQVFERTLATEHLEYITQKIHSGAELTDQDYGRILENIETLGRIGYFESPNDQAASSESRALTDEAADQADIELKVKYNAVQQISSLISALPPLLTPQKFKDDIYRSVLSHWNSNDYGPRSVIMMLRDNHLLPQSDDLVIETLNKTILFSKVSEYMSFVEDFKISRQASENGVFALSESRLREIANEVEQAGDPLKARQIRVIAVDPRITPEQ